MSAVNQPMDEIDQAQQNQIDALSKLVTQLMATQDIWSGAIEGFKKSQDDLRQTLRGQLETMERRYQEVVQKHAADMTKFEEKDARTREAAIRATNALNALAVTVEKKNKQLQEMFGVQARSPAQSPVAPAVAPPAAAPAPTNANT